MEKPQSISKTLSKESTEREDQRKEQKTHWTDKLKSYYDTKSELHWESISTGDGEYSWTPQHKYFRKLFKNQVHAVEDTLERQFGLNIYADDNNRDEDVKAEVGRTWRTAQVHNGISNRMLRVVALPDIINAMLKLRYSPKRWENAQVILIPKRRKDQLLLQNYLPISCQQWAR